MTTHQRFMLLLALCLGLSLMPQTRAADPIISEFMAANRSVLADEDGEFSDWVEIFNPGPGPLTLEGWYLTDTPTRLNKWRFPATNLNSGAYLVVFASGKDRAVAGAPLHTSFNLGSSGEYLALVRPDGSNVVSAYAPLFPAQVADVSFGIVTASELLSPIDSNSLARFLVPADASLGSGWTAPDFGDQGWQIATNGLGFDYRTVQVVSDDFNASKDYSGRDTTGTIWSGLQYGGDTVVSAANANFTNAGRLTLSSKLGNWENGDNDGLLLFIANVTNDFTAEVEIPASDNPAYHSMGLMARMADINAAGPGEDWVAAMMFDQYGVGTTMRATDNGVSTTPASGLTHRFMQLTRSGATFSVLSKASRDEPYSLRASTTRADLAGQPLQVGLWQATYSANVGAAQFDNFTLRLGPPDSGPVYDALLQTDLKDAMLGSSGLGLNASLYTRWPFTITNASQVSQLVLTLNYDDGFVAYLNGTEVVRRNAPAGPAWNSTAAAARTKIQGLTPERIDLSSFAGLLQPGPNVLAIQGLNAAANDPDFLLLAQLEARARVDVQPERWRYFAVPTPGEPNGQGVKVLGAVLSDHRFSPALPAAADPIAISARVRPTFDQVTGVVLHYRVMFASETTLPMFDDGLHGDALAGDGIYGGLIPPGTATPGQMLRWYITATDTSGTVSRWPLYEPGLEAPEYFGTVIANPQIHSELPIFQYFIQNLDWYKLPNGGAYSKYIITNATVFYAGRFYDNVRVRIRGASSVIWKFPKQSLKFDFNPGQRFVYATNRETVTQININEFWTDKAYIRNNLSMQEVYKQAGVPAQDLFFVSTYLNGIWHSLSGFVEEPDQRFLRREGLDPDGALYKMYNPLQEADIRPPVPPGVNPDNYGGAEKKTREWEDFSDLQALVDGIKPTNSTRTAFMFDNLDLPEVINYCAASLIIQDWDRFPKNHFMYRDTLGSREWQILPWDADLSWGYQYWMDDTITATHPTFSHPLYGETDYVGPYGQSHALFDALYRTPVFRQMYLRRARTLLDQILQPPGTPPEQLKLEGAINRLEQLLTTEVNADKLKWGVPFGSAQTMTQALTLVRSNYLAPRRTHLFVNHGPPSGLIPAPQFAYPTLYFAAVEFNPSSANQAQEYVHLTNGHPFAVDLSGWTLEGAVRFAFKPGTVMPSNSSLYLSPDVSAFRARSSGPRGGLGLFVQGNYSGQLSARGESLLLRDHLGRVVANTNYPGAPSLLQQYLRITELMYHPLPPAGDTNDSQQFEFIELKNISTNLTLNLAGARFTDGVQFDFSGSSVTSLPPGATVLVVKNLAAFVSRYGPGLNIAGAWTGALDNAGERIRLVDASGEEILDFTYDDRSCPLSDGLGFSLVVADETAEPDAWGDQAIWKSGSQAGGTPGQGDVYAIMPALVNEVLARTENPLDRDTIELYNPGNTPLPIGGWFLTDEFAVPGKFRIPDDTIIPPLGWVVFDEQDFNPNPGVEPGFAFNSGGDQVYLFSADLLGNLTGFVHGFDFGPSDDGVSFGRYVSSDGREHFVPQVRRSFGQMNAGPQVGPLVISEIMYHPAESGAGDNAGVEYVELLNASSNTLALSDPLALSTTWRLAGGMQFAFPQNVSVAPGAAILLVSFDPADATALANFKSSYGIDSAVQVFGPGLGRLDNNSDRVELQKPTLLHGTNLAYVTVDRVDYLDQAPWPQGADGFGLSLQRVGTNLFGNDPVSWQAAIPNPGIASVIQGTLPTIYSQPQSRTVMAFTPVSLSVSAAGAGLLRYQWLRDGLLVPDATNATLLFEEVTPEQGGQYQVAVFNESGSTVSSNATLTVRVGPVITSQPLASQMVRQGLTAVLGVAAVSGSATPLRYQWQFNGNNLPAGTNAALTLLNVQTNQSGIYHVWVADDLGRLRSQPAQLSIMAPPRIGQGPLSQSIVAGGTVTFSVLVTNGTTPLNYQWRFGSTTLTNIYTTDYTSFLTLRNVRTNQAGTYHVRVTNASLNTAISPTASLTVLADTDADGVPDAWENSFGLDPANPSDANADPDLDGMANWEEYVAGTDPTDEQSCLKLAPLTTTPPPSGVQFFAVSNRTYTVEYEDALGANSWSRLADIVARGTNRLEQVADPAADTNRFYRLVTPRRE